MPDSLYLQDHQRDARLVRRRMLGTLDQPDRPLAVPAIARRARQHQHAAAPAAQQHLDDRRVQVARAADRIRHAALRRDVRGEGTGAVVTRDDHDLAADAFRRREELPRGRQLIASGASRGPDPHGRARSGADPAAHAQRRINPRHELALRAARFLPGNHADRLVGAVEVALLAAGAELLVHHRGGRPGGRPVVGRGSGP